MKHYIGRRTKRCCYVSVVTDRNLLTARPLPPRLDLYNHSPDGFEWGYGGSGPAQLALAILADALRDDDQAVDLHQAFKRAHTARLTGDTWEISEEAVLTWVADHLAGSCD